MSGTAPVYVNHALVPAVVSGSGCVGKVRADPSQAAGNETGEHDGDGDPRDVLVEQRAWCCDALCEFDAGRNDTHHHTRKILNRRADLPPPLRDKWGEQRQWQQRYRNAGGKPQQGDCGA